MQNRYSLLTLLLFSLLLFNCNCGKSKYHVDVSGIKVNLEIERFDTDFLALRKNNSTEAINQLQKKYPLFFPFFIEQISQLGFANDTTSALRDSIQLFLSNSYYEKVFDTTEIVYNKIDDIKSGLEEGIKHYKYYFPDIVVPKILTYVNGPRCFTYGDELLAIGLDNYLGADYYYYKIVQPPIPAFLTRRLSREYIVPNAMQVLATNYFPFNDDGKKLLDEMLYNGKIFFLLQHILPDTPDSILTGYKQEKLEWCDANESEIWKFFIKNNLIYQTDQLVYKKYVNDGPNTSGMPPEAPGNIGSWVGWQIIQQYAGKHPELSLLQIMREGDSQKILSESKYKP